MKVIIDLIEDIASAINNDKSFTLSAMGLKEDENSQFNPTWEADLCSYEIDEKEQKIFLFLGKGGAINVGQFLADLDTLDNKQMMNEIKISYSKEGQRVDVPLLGFGESFKDKKYLLFIGE